MDIWIGVDIGSSSCRAVACDSRLRVIGMAQEEYPMTVNALGWCEHDPAVILRAACNVIKQVLELSQVVSNTVRGMGFSGFMHSIMGVNRRLEPITPCIAWADLRTLKQVEEIGREFGDTVIYQRTGCPIHTTYVLAKLRWFRDTMPQEFQQVWKFMSVKEWILAQLTDEWVCDLGIASGSGLLNIHDLTWDPIALKAGGITPERLFTLVDPQTVLPGMSSKFASLQGLPSHIPIVVGSSDAALSSVGAGAVLPKTFTAMIGTSAAVRILTQQPYFDDEGRSWCYYACDGYWVVGGATNNGGNVLRWYKDLFDEVDYEDLSMEAESAPPGSSGLLFLAFLAGERAPNWNSDARGVLFGLNLSHGIPHIIRSIMEGVVYQVKGIYNILRPVCPLPSSIRATGGFANSDVWLSIMASVFGQALDVLPHVEGSAVGAAALARTTLLNLGGLEWVSECIQPIMRVEPSRQEHEVYERLYKQYLRIYNLLEKEFTAISQFQRGGQSHEYFP